MLNRNEMENELNESQAIIKQQEVKVQEIKKYNETLGKLEETEKKLTDTTNTFNQNMVVMNNKFETMSGNIDKFNANNSENITVQKNLLSNFSNEINNIINILNSNIKQNTTEIFNDSFAVIQDSIKNFNITMAQANENTNNICKIELDKLIETFNTFINNIKSENNTLKSIKNKFYTEHLFIIFTIYFVLILNLMYNINYQFHCIKWLDTREIPDFANWCVNCVMGIFIFLGFKWLFSTIFNKNR